MAPHSQPKVLLVHSHYGEAPAYFTQAAAAGKGFIRREIDLTADDFATCCGVITTNHLDQIGFMAWKSELEAMLNRGGRWFFNGHIMREFVQGLQTYVPIANARRADLVLEKLSDHPLFAGVTMSELEENRGVAGFYGRGYNPLPKGALAVTGVGPDRLPLDWEWQRPEGGAIFSHAGNDLGSMNGINPTHAQITPRLIAWTLGELA